MATAFNLSDPRDLERIVRWHFNSDVSSPRCGLLEFFVRDRIAQPLVFPAQDQYWLLQTLRCFFDTTSPSSEFIDFERGRAVRKSDVAGWCVVSPTDVASIFLSVPDGAPVFIPACDYNEHPIAYEKLRRRVPEKHLE